MPAAVNSVKAALNHAEGEVSGERSCKIRVRPGRITVSMKRLGTASGKLTVYKSDSGEESDRTKLDSKSFNDDSVDVVKETTITSPFIFLVADFSDTNFGQVEVTITTS